MRRQGTAMVVDNLTPRSGDVILKAETSDDGSRYNVRQIPGGPQVSCNSRQSAVTFASRFAQRYRVGMWEEQDGAYTRLRPTAHAGGRS
jgi:hypothetical protein